MGREASPLPSDLKEEGELLARIWGRLLGLERMDWRRGFLEQGGDSLTLLQAVAAARSAGLIIPPTLLAEGRSIVEIVAWLRGATSDIAREGFGEGGLPNAIRSPGAMSCRELRADAEAILAGLALPDGPREGALSPPGTVLLTGGTGTLGGWLLLELLQRTDADVVCLVRGDDPARARTRLFEAVTARTGRSLGPWDGRIDIVLGDVSRPQLGLDEGTWGELAGRVDAVYHAAARVHLVLPYAALRADNVGASGEVLRFLAAGRAKRLHHVSTLSVFVATDRDRGRLSEGDHLRDTREVHGGYAQSKWAAEWLLRRAAGRAGPVIHYRPGLITPDTRTGRGGPTDFLTLFIRGLARLGCLPPLPAGELWLDVTPVDYAAAALVHLSLHARDDGQTFHLANRRGVSLGMIIDALAAEGIAVPEVPVADWRGRWLELERQAPEADAACLAVCRGLSEAETFARYRTMDLFQATGVVFDTGNTDAGLAGTAIRCPVADGALLRLYVRGVLGRAEEHS